MLIIRVGIEETKSHVDLSGIDWCSFAACVSPALNGSSTLQCFECGNAVQIRNRIMFDFYLGLPHITNRHLWTSVGQLTFLMGKMPVSNHTLVDDDERVMKAFSFFACRNPPHVSPFQLNAMTHDDIIFPLKFILSKTMQTVTIKPMSFLTLNLPECVSQGGWIAHGMAFQQVNWDWS